MDKCPKNMTLVAINIFGLITIFYFFKIHILYPFLKLKDPQIILQRRQSIFQGYFKNFVRCLASS